MAQDLARELADLSAVHAFCITTLEKTLGHPVPVPGGLTPSSLPAGLPAEQRDAVLLNIQRRWLNLLDLAISPAVIRLAVQDGANAASLAPLLRYFVLKTNRTPGDRDKADLIVTQLLRAEVGADKVMTIDSARFTAAAFEERLCDLLEDCPDLAEQHEQLAREFEFLRAEVDEFTDFDHLIESGMIARVRDIKESFGSAFFHPHVLAAAAVHNAYFSRRFDELFRRAARQIKEFAARVQDEGGNLAAKVDGDIAVKHLADVEEQKVLRREYERAQEDFRKISRYKRAVDKRKPAAPPGKPPVAAAVAAPAAPPRVAAAPPVTPGVFGTPQNSMQNAENRSMANQMEEGKLRSVEDSIKNFVRTLNGKNSALVPLRNVSVPMIASDIEAFKADYGQERSFRADFAAVQRRIVAVQGRLMSEMVDFHAKQKSEYLWKPHADSLTFLITRAQELIADASRIAELAIQRGLMDKVATITATSNKLRSHAQSAVKALEMMNYSAG